MSGARPPAVAGRFYPADPGELTELVTTLLKAAAPPPGPGTVSPSEGQKQHSVGWTEERAQARQRRARDEGSRYVRRPERSEQSDTVAYVVPHAGLRFSGPVAATVYARLAPAERVVLLGPAHFVPLSGCAVPSVRAFATPLGEVPVDLAGCRRLAEAGLAVVDDRPHEREHSLEVQLPFLQTVLEPGWTLLPVAVGPSTVDAVPDLLDAALATPAAVLCSTDLSHHLPDAAARDRDRRTATAILDLAPGRIGPHDACGYHALTGLLTWARRHHLSPTLLDLRTSADTAGALDRVVGYGAFALMAVRA